jgi:hypothetical protein
LVVRLVVAIMVRNLCARSYGRVNGSAGRKSTSNEVEQEAGVAP